MLGLRHELLNIVWYKTTSDTLVDQCIDTISKWLDGQGHEPVTWEEFVEALDKLELRELSDELKNILR